MIRSTIMDGFFVTVNCSQILDDSSETSYKIFIDKNKMSIVYELKEWIRFMFNLENCFFLIHDNAVIHELEDVKVLEILKHLEIRLCLQSDCIHRKIEKTLLSKLNLFTYWNEVKVHKLFVARQNNLTQKVSHNLQYCSKAKEKSSTFLLESSQNTFVQLDESELTNNEGEISSPPECMDNVKTTTESDKIYLSEKNQLNLKEISTAVKKIQSEPKIRLSERKNSRGEVPFSLGALLSDIREKAQNHELKEKKDTVKEKESFNSICLQDEKNYKNIPAEMNFVNKNDGFVRRRRKRQRHKREILKVDINSLFPDYSGNHQELSFSTKPNHIRFSDSNEIMETEAANNNFNTIDSKSEDSYSCKVLNDESLMSTAQLIFEPTPVIKENEEKNDCSLIIKDQDEALQMFTDFNNGMETNVAPKDKEVDSSFQNYSPLESLKKKIKANGIISRFY